MSAPPITGTESPCKNKNFYFFIHFFHMLVIANNTQKNLNSDFTRVGKKIMMQKHKK